MKKLSILALTMIFFVSCSSFDKYKTPNAPNAGLAEGEKSSYLLNKDKVKVSKQEIKEPAPKVTKTTKTTKTSANKKKTTTKTKVK